MCDVLSVISSKPTAFVAIVDKATSNKYKPTEKSKPLEYFKIIL
tara:strand:+ start:2738 stop:2869 length:132 start_codon:yes stop_codon:yes gene_type:complete